MIFRSKLLPIILVLVGCSDPEWERYVAKHHCEQVDQRLEMYLMPYTDSNGYTQMMQQWYVKSQTFKCDNNQIVVREY